MACNSLRVPWIAAARAIPHVLSAVAQGVLQLRVRDAFEINHTFNIVAARALHEQLGSAGTATLTLLGISGKAGTDRRVAHRPVKSIA
jgi:hypothetical protein